MSDQTMKLAKTGALGAVVLLSVSLAACGGGATASEATPEEAMPLPVVVVPAEIDDIHASYATTASILADAEAPVLARVRGEVVQILVEEGDRVAPGQVLARLDGDRLRLEMLRAKTEYEKARSEYARMADLHERSLISTAAYDDLRFSVDALKASYELKKLNYDYTAIRAPIGGVISARNVKQGSNVNISEPVFKVTDTQTLVAYLSIPQTELHKFSVGDEAIVAVDSAPGLQIRASIARISPTIDMATGTFRATVYIDNAKNALAPGMFGRFSIAYEEHSNAVVIPSAAVVREDNELVVYVVENGSAIRRTIQTGIESGGLVEVISGLSADDSIVLSGQAQLRDGTRVMASAATGATDVTG